jgi:hypothetical protein
MCHCRYRMKAVLSRCCELSGGEWNMSKWREAGRTHRTFIVMWSSHDGISPLMDVKTEHRYSVVYTNSKLPEELIDPKNCLGEISIMNHADKLYRLTSQTHILRPSCNQFPSKPQDSNTHTPQHSCLAGLPSDQIRFRRRAIHEYINI